MNLSLQFTAFIKQNNLFSPKDRLLLAVSGGIDSVVLYELCYQAGFDFVTAHCNFQLRGEESVRDEEFVKQLGEKYGKEVLVKRFDTAKYALENKVSIQVAARELRYDWFEKLIESRKSGTGNEFLPDLRPQTSDWIATAHHLDDNIETLLLNFFKGTGIAGLRAMQPKQGKIVRPLLFAKKEDLRQFAETHRLNWVEDSSNESDKYSRNYFRNQVIPLIQKIYPEAINNLANNLNRFRDIELLYQQSINRHKKKLFEQKGNEIHIPVLKLKKTEPLHTIVHEIIREFNFSPAQVHEVIDLLDSESGKYVQSSSHRILKNRNWLVISPNQNKSSQTILIEDGTKKIFFEKGILTLEQPETGNWKPETANSVAMLDICEIRFPLLLRKWKQGDYFYPLGMRKKKKIARFLIDNKLSKIDKEKVWVLEMNKKIIWVVGMRIDDRFKINPGTKRILKIEMGMT